MADHGERQILKSALSGKRIMITGGLGMIGSGIGTKFKDMVNIIVEVAGSGNIKNIPWPSDYINVENGDYVTEISKISTMLGCFSKGIA